MPVDDFESKLLRLSLTGTTVTPDNLQDFRPMKIKRKLSSSKRESTRTKSFSVGRN